MNNLTKLVFDALGVDKDEEFMIKEDCTKSIYQISGILVVYVREQKSDFWHLAPIEIRHLLNGERTIVKIPHPTERDKEIIKALLMLNCKFAAKDKNQVICAYTSKPFKERESEYWDVKQGQSISLDTLTPDDLAFIRWEDAEPVDLEAIV